MHLVKLDLIDEDFFDFAICTVVASYLTRSDLRLDSQKVVIVLIILENHR